MLAVTRMIDVARVPGRREDVAREAPARYAQVSSGPPVVVWNVVRHCNMSCPHCYAAATETPSDSDLTTDEALRVLGELAAVGVKIIIFSGGEPLLRGDLFQLAERAVALGMSPQLSSNGVLIDEATAARLAEVGFGYVGASIDGVPRFNDTYRGMVGGFAKAAAGLRYAGAAGLTTGLRMTLTQKNVDQLGDMIGYARDIGVDRFYVSHLLYSGRAARMSELDLSAEECRSTLFYLFETAERHLDEGRGPAFVTGGNDSDGPLLLLWLEERYGQVATQRVRELLDRRRGNSAGERIISIDHRGRVHPDQFWQTLSLGNLRERPLAEILHSPMRAQLRQREQLLTGRCRACQFVGLCRGSHRERALAATGDMWASDPACVMTDAEIGYDGAEHQSAGGRS